MYRAAKLTLYGEPTGEFRKFRDKAKAEEFIAKANRLENYGRHMGKAGSPRWILLDSGQFQELESGKSLKSIVRGLF